MSEIRRDSIRIPSGEKIECYFPPYYGKAGDYVAIYVKVDKNNKAVELDVHFMLTDNFMDRHEFARSDDEHLFLAVLDDILEQIGVRRNYK